MDWAGQRTGDGYAAQGNILVGAETVDALADDVRGDGGPEPRRAAARVPRGRAGRGRRPARPAVGGAARRRARRRLRASSPTSLVDLRVDDHERPIEELQRLYGLHDRLFGVTPREDWLPLEGELARRGRDAARAARLRLARRRGRASRTSRSASTATTAIDPVVLEALRELRREDAPARRDRGHPGLRHARRGSRCGRRSASPRSASTRTPRRTRATRSSRSTPRSSSGTRRSTSCVSGHATFTVDGEEVDAPAGTLVYLDDAAQKRHAIANEAGTTVLAIGGVPGKHEASAWEYFFPALPLLRAGRLRRGAARCSRRGWRRRTCRCMHYQLACVEALAGQPRACARRADDRGRRLPSRLREHAQTDEDFASIRDDPRFPLAVAGQAERRRRALAQRRDRVGAPAARRAARRRSPARAAASRRASCSPSASANALCHCSPPNGTSCSAVREAGDARRPRSPRPSRRRRRAARRRSSGSRSRADSSRRASAPSGGPSRGGEVAVSTPTSPRFGEPPHVVAEHPGRERPLAHDDPRVRRRRVDLARDDGAEREVAERAVAVPALEAGVVLTSSGSGAPGR